MLLGGYIFFHVYMPDFKVMVKVDEKGNKNFQKATNLGKKVNQGLNLKSKRTKNMLKRHQCFPQLPMY